MDHPPAAPQAPSSDAPATRRRRHRRARWAGGILACALAAFLAASTFGASGPATARSAASWSTYCTGHPHTANRHCVLAAPTGLTASAVTASGATLTWVRVRGASGYTVFAAGSALATTSATSMAVSARAAGSTTDFSVATRNAAGQSAPGAADQVTTLPASPTGVVATPGDGQIDLAWPAVNGATAYVVESGGAAVLTTASPAATLSGLVDGTTYSLDVVATDGAGNSSPSTVVLATPVFPLPAGPTGLTASAVTASGATLTWDPVVGATGYQVYAQGLPIGFVTTATYADTTAAPGSSVAYTVAAVDPSGTGPAAGVDVLTLPAEPDPVTASAVTASGATLSWDPVTGAVGYLVAADGSLIASVFGTDYTDGSASGGITVSYTVVAVDASGAGAPSNATTVLTLPDVPDDLATSAVTAVGATLTWDPVAGATSYLVTTDGTGAASVSVPTYTDTSSPGGTTVSYTVAAVDASGPGGSSVPVSALTLPAAPTGLVARAVTGSDATLAWNPVDGATGYTVFAGGTPVLGTTATTATDAGEVPGATVLYTVTAWDATGESGPSAVVPVVLVPSVPTGVVVYPADGALDVRWTPVAGATSYQVSVGTLAPDVVATASTDVGGLTDGTAYPVTVASTDAGGNSTPSAPVSGTPSAATVPGTAFGLLNMEGVDTHSSYATTPYADTAQTERLLGQLGVLHVRDSLAYGASGPQQSQLAFYNALHAQGIGVDLILSPNGSTSDLAARLGVVASSLSTAVDAIEAPNELNGSGQPDWAAQDIAYQKALYAGVKASPTLRATPVLGPSLVNSQALLNGDQGYLALGDLSSVLDLGNIHVYPGGRTPTWNMDVSLAAERTVSGDSPVWVTETGYHDAVDLPGNFSVSDAAAATYLPRLLLEWHQRGAGRVNLYELYDEQADPGQTDYQDHFGLVGLDGTPKAQFTALQNFNGLLADTSASFVPTPLTYEVSSGSTKVSSMLLEKSTGQYVLFLWQDVSVSDTSTDPPTPVVVPPTPVTVTLGAPVASITQYRPSLSAAAQSSVTSTATVTVGLQGDATALVIQP